MRKNKTNLVNIYKYTKNSFKEISMKKNKSSSNLDKINLFYNKSIPKNNINLGLKKSDVLFKINSKKENINCFNKNTKNTRKMRNIEKIDYKKDLNGKTELKSIYYNNNNNNNLLKYPYSYNKVSILNKNANNGNKINYSNFYCPKDFNYKLISYNKNKTYINEQSFNNFSSYNNNINKTKKILLNPLKKLSKISGLSCVNIRKILDYSLSRDSKQIHKILRNCLPSVKLTNKILTKGKNHTNISFKVSDEKNNISFNTFNDDSLYIDSAISEESESSFNINRNQNQKNEKINKNKTYNEFYLKPKLIYQKKN